MDLLGVLNFDEVSDDDVSEYEKRTAVRAVLVNPEGLVALMYSTIQNFYKLPGGGVETGETLAQAIVRECLEETGFLVSELKNIGEVQEIRSSERLLQNTYAFFARVVGSPKAPSLTESEIKAGFVVEWHPLDTAFEKLENMSGSRLGDYVSTRERLILKNAATVLL